MTLVMLDEIGEVSLDFSSYGVPEDNPQVQVLLARGFDTTFTVRDFGKRSPLKVGKGKKAIPVEVHVCPACVVKVSTYIYDPRYSPLSIVCMATKQFLFLPPVATSQALPVVMADLGTAAGIQQLQRHNGYFKRARTVLRDSSIVSVRFFPETMSYEPRVTWPEADARYLSYVTGLICRPIALQMAAVHLGIHQDRVDAEVTRLQTVARAIAFGEPYSW